MRAGGEGPPTPIATVYLEMLLQVCTDYNGIADFRELKFSEIRTFYSGLIEGLKKSTAPTGK